MVEARDMIDRYYEAYPGVRMFLDSVVARAKQTGYAETMYGRRRHIPELKAKNPQLRGFGERTAMNHPMQGTAADIIKIAMARVSRRLEEEGFAAHIILQVPHCRPLQVERLTTSLSRRPPCPPNRRSFDWSDLGRRQVRARPQFQSNQNQKDAPHQQGASFVQ